MDTPTGIATCNSNQGKVFRLPLPSIGKQYVRRQMLAFRKVIESQVLTLHGEINPWHAKVIRSACKSFAAAQRVDRILSSVKEPGDVAIVEEKRGNATATVQRGLTHSEFQNYLDRSTKFERECDAALKSLGLDGSQKKDIWDLIYSQPAVQPSQLPASCHGTNGKAAEPEAAIDASTRPAQSSAIPGNDETALPKDSMNQGDDCHADGSGGCDK
jgi:hypothetical protein